MARKRLRLDSKAGSRKCADAYDDRFSQLPDDILVVILSFLSLQEAACTSVLSSRWLNLWKHNSCLNFDAGTSLSRVAEDQEIPSKKWLKYVKWVNGIIRSHNALTLKQFRICFGLTISAKKVVARWLEFAFVRHVQVLELDFSGRNEAFYFRHTYCPFPLEFLTQSSGGTSTSKRHSNSSGIDFKCLKVLSLKRVDATVEMIEFFLSNCPLLEKLAVDDTYKLLDVDVSGPSLVLKHLELVRCHKLVSVKVSAPRLTSLVLPDVEKVLLENVPELVEVSVDCRCYGDTGSNLLPALSCCISQLEVLILRLTNKQQGIVLSTFSEMPKLKRLVIEYWVNSERSLMGLTSLIRASSYLQEFVLKIVDPERGGSFCRELKNTVKFPHHHLKVFEFCGYVGRDEDLELLEYILDNSVVLDKIIIDSRYLVLRYPGDLIHEELPRYGQADEDYMTQQLEARVPQHIELIIL